MVLWYHSNQRTLNSNTMTPNNEWLAICTDALAIIVFMRAIAIIYKLITITIIVVDITEKDEATDAQQSEINKNMDKVVYNCIITGVGAIIWLVLTLIRHLN